MYLNELSLTLFTLVSMSNNFSKLKLFFQKIKFHISIFTIRGVKYVSIEGLCASWVSKYLSLQESGASQMIVCQNQLHKYFIMLMVGTL